MKHRNLALFLLLLLSALPAAAQVQGGSVSGTVKDQQGGVLPGVCVVAQGTDATLTATTRADGAFHFLSLAPGPYKITAALSGFATLVRETVIVEVGKDLDLPITLRIAPVAETVNVTAAPPIVNAAPAGTATNFGSLELTKIPTSRDPFALVRAVPGALTERVNVGGNETGQQLLAVAKAARPQDTSWTLDGVEITDMAAPGQSATYFNFDNFDEVHVSTAGNDIRERTGALTVNLVVKRGGNQYHGGARGYYAGDSLQAANIPAELATLATPVTPDKADHLTRSSDYGFDLGGPLLRERAWFYGSYSRQNVQLFRRSSGAIDRTTLDDPNLKVNAQATAKDLVSFLFYNGYKIKDNRPPGVVSFEQPAATFHQDNFYGDAPFHGLWKLADDRVFTSHLFMSVKYGYFNTGVGLTPEGGMDQQAGRNLVTQTAYGSFQRQISARPQHTATVDMNSFVNLLGASHDVKYGLGFRTTDVVTENMYPGNGILAITQTATDLRAQVFREGQGGNRANYTHLYASDTMTKGRATLNLGLRYDRQWGKADPSTTAGNPAFPELVPGIVFAGYATPFSWTTFSPRAGLVYALDESRKTAARVTYSRFAGQLSTSTVGFSNVASSLGSVTYRWTDLNGDGFAQANEVNTAAQLASSNPTTANRLDPNLKAPTTESVVAGVEREVVPNLAVTAAYSYSRTSRLFGNAAANLTTRAGVTLADYTPFTTVSGTLPDGTAFSVPVFAANAAKFAASGSALLLTNAPGYSTDYHGIELGFVKRLSTKWMGRASFSYNVAREHFSDPAGRYNSTGNPTPTPTEPLLDGGPFAPAENGGSGNYYLNAKWQLNVNGMYQAPYGIELAANVFGRQGYPFPVFRTTTAGVAPNTETVSVLVSPQIDTFRYPNVWDTDLRIARELAFQSVRIRVMADLFNVANANTALVRVNSFTSSAFNALTQNMTPRILRVGVTIGF